MGNNILALYLNLTSESTQELLPRFNWRDRLFLWARWYLTPYQRMAEKLPQKGKILDLGSGHGLLSLTLAVHSPERVVLGIDHDDQRIQLACRAAHSISNLHFEKGSLLQPPQGSFQGIALIDVMHYFSPDEQHHILKNAFDLLEPGGTLILREVNPSGGIISKWNRIYERFATATGFTRSNHQTSMHFRSPEGWIELLKKIGLSASYERCSSLFFADILFVGKK